MQLHKTQTHRYKHKHTDTNTNTSTQIRPLIATGNTPPTSPPASPCAHNLPVCVCSSSTALKCTKHKHISTQRPKKVDTYTTRPFRLAMIFCSQWSLSACPPWVILHTLGITPGNSDAIIAYITSTYSGKHCLVLYRQRLLCKHVNNLSLSTHPIPGISVCVNDIASCCYNTTNMLPVPSAPSNTFFVVSELRIFTQSTCMLLVGPSL